MVQNIPMMQPTWIAQIAPIELTEQLESVAAIPEPRLIIMALAVILSIAIGAVFWRASKRKTPELEQAFRHLSRRLKLGKRRMDLARQLAAAGGMPAIALLLSEHAFDLAVGALEPVLAHGAIPLAARTRRPDRTPGMNDASLASLRRTLFGDQ